MTLPWTTVQAALEDGIRARWIELAGDSDAWPCDLARAQHAIFQVPAWEGIREGGPGPYKPQPRGLLSAEAVLEAHGIQDLADQIAAITRAAVDAGGTLRFNVRIELGCKSAPEAATVETINALLSEVSEELKLG